MADADNSDSKSNDTNPGELILSEDAMPEELLILPVFGRPFFPAQIQPLVIDEEPWAETIEALGKTEHHLIGLLYAGRDERDLDNEDEFSGIGCVARLHNVVGEEQKIQFIAQGVQRFKVKKWVSTQRPYVAQVTYPKIPVEKQGQIKAYAMALIKLIKELIPLNPLYSEELKNFLNYFNLNDPSPLADFAAAITSADGDELQAVVETIPLLRRMEKILLLLRKELEVAKLQSEISQQVEDKISKQQREFFLREQLKIIQRELGLSKDDKSVDIDEFEERMKALEPPKHVQKRYKEELQKLSILETGSSEYGVTRNYLDWITSVPWGKTSKDNLDLAHARQVLDESHAGLKDVKSRITEFLAEGAFRGSVSGSIILLVGPPGVGKTSIGRAIADSLNRKFYRFSVGGMRDEAEIKGHRRTYIGAMPGKLVQALKDVEVSNPVIMLDEIDKIGNSYQGDPASALLEVLDPEQNREFLDHYLDLRLDLSKVLFICTANQLDSIPRALIDRMDMIRLSGYIAAEKLDIAKTHLWPRLRERANVKKSQIKISDSGIKAIIEGYARESGVRGLEKQMHKILRKGVVRLLEGDSKSINVSAKNLSDFLGEPIFRNERQITGVGVVTGLAWTSLGGATLPVEAALVHHVSRGFKLTGKLGKVMQESAEIAYSYTSANLDRYNAPEDFFDKAFVHVHVPEGATPKDGPSAGVTMTTALLSLALNKKLRRNIAMTGELTLTGKVLPVGGIREKIIAARRLKIGEVIMPQANERDYHELPGEVKEGVKVHFAAHYDDVFDIVF